MPRRAHGLYSQRDEERYIADVFAGKPPARLLDIGAWAPFDFSNSRNLIEQGWEALLIEPSPEPFLGLVKEYGNDPRIKLLNAAVGFNRGALKMYATADAVSTSDEATYKQWKNTGGYYGSFYCMTITVEEILNQFGGFDFVSIDAEGKSADIFVAYIKHAQPECICVEHDGREGELMEHAQQYGYKQIYHSGENVIFAR